MFIQGPKELADMVQFTAELFEIAYFKLEIGYSDSHSECIRNLDGSFKITIQADLDELQNVRHVAHEMQHLKQFKHDRLYDTEAGMTVWEGVEYPPCEYLSDEYFLTPWEMEARAMECWVEYRWENK